MPSSGQPPAQAPQPSCHENAPLIAVTLAAFALRLWLLDAKALGYDEAATAIMSRAPVPDIIRFHWDAAFEHLPLWVLLMHFWSKLAGQSEHALRLLPAFAGVLSIPMAWSLLKRARPFDAPWRLLTALLIALSPVLALYAQEARMYTLVVLLALASTYLALRLVEQPQAMLILAYVLVNWSMLGLQYYSVLLIAAHVLYAAFSAAVSPDARRRTPWLSAALAAGCSVAPLLLWMAFAPGFRETVEVVLAEAGKPGLSVIAFLTELWRDLGFGALRWQPDISAAGLLIVPLFLAGAAAALYEHRRGVASSPASPYRWDILFLTIVLLPMLLSAAMFRTLATRYILYVAPFIFALVAYVVLALVRANRPLGLAAAGLALAVALLGLSYYFGPYHKSEYRDMARYLLERYTPGQEVVVIEAPRQHLLAKYYFGQDFPLEPVPAIPLPDYWPVTAPRVVPEEIDDQVQRYLRDYASLWLILSAEAEVDPGEFLAKYLTAVAYNQDCQAWLDVRLCRFISPNVVRPELETELAANFGDELVLEYARVAADPRHRSSVSERAPLLVELGWFAQAKPALDYKVSLRLIGPQGETVTQLDQHPIGTLLPPTAWSAGDRKPGYAALTIPPSTPAGSYSLQASVYDPATLIPVPYREHGNPASASAPIILGLVEIDGTIRLLPAGSGDER